MRHRNPSGDLEKIFEVSLDLLLTKLVKERLGRTTGSNAKARSASTDGDGATSAHRSDATSAERTGPTSAERTGATSAERTGATSARRDGASRTDQNVHPGDSDTGEESDRSSGRGQPEPGAAAERKARKQVPTATSAMNEPGARKPPPSKKPARRGHVRRRSGARSGLGTASSAPMSTPRAIVARLAASSSWTTSRRRPSGAATKQRISDCDVELTIIYMPSRSSVASTWRSGSTCDNGSTPRPPRYDDSTPRPHRRRRSRPPREASARLASARPRCVRSSPAWQRASIRERRSRRSSGTRSGCSRSVAPTRRARASRRPSRRPSRLGRDGDLPARPAARDPRRENLPRSKPLPKPERMATLAAPDGDDAHLSDQDDDRVPPAVARHPRGPRAPALTVGCRGGSQTALRLRRNPRPA